MGLNSITIGVAILTYNSKRHLPFCLPPLLLSPLKPKVLVVDPSSTDGTDLLAKEMGAEVLTIPYREFNHGLTRELARKHLGTDIVVFMTPDAYGKEPEFLEKLVIPLLEEKAELAYARQLPKPGSSPFEALPRLLNYPSKSHSRSFEDRKTWGSYLYFFSDSCGAYLNNALERIGGFSECLLGEDALACAKILKLGGRVAYVAEAEVFHSHTYSLFQEFRRYFDTGYARKEIAPFLADVGSDASYGKSFAKNFLSELSLFQVPYGFLQLCMKWSGYQIGKRFGQILPLFMKKTLSSQRFYWNSIPYLEKLKRESSSQSDE